MQAYPEPVLRGFRDLDLLVRPGDRAGTLSTLAALGYTSSVADLSPGRLAAYHRYNGQDLLVAPGRYPLEPHWALAPRCFHRGLPAEALIARSVPLACPGGGMLGGPAPEDALLIAALHGTKEHWARLIWLADIAAMLRAWPHLDGAAVLERARRAGVERMLLVALLLARELLGAAAPQPLAGRAAEDPAATRLAARLARRMRAAAPDAAPSVFRLTRFGWRVRDSLGDRLDHAVRTLLTARAPHFRAVQLPEGLAFLYPAVGLGLDWVVWPARRQLRGRHG